LPLIGPIATALPPHRLAQRQLAESLPGGRERATALAASTRIRERALACPLPWYMEPHGHRDRAEAFARVGLQLVEQAAADALRMAGVPAQEVASIVLVSTTGVAAPSLDARLMNRLPFAPGTRRVPVWGLGCAGGVGGLNLAAALARAEPASHHLLVCVELCSLLFDLPGVAAGDRKALVAASLFGDGCAATVVSGDATGASGLAHLRESRHLFPATERVMGWDVADGNLDVVISPEIPGLVASTMAQLTHGICGGRPPDHWVLHPGGAKVLDAYRGALGLDGSRLQASEDTLRDYGNMSSPTVLFALRRAAAQAAPGERLLAAALGPGFASEMAMLEAP